MSEYVVGKIVDMPARDYVPINTDLAGNPVNYLIVFLMVAIAGLGLSLIFEKVPKPE